VSFYTQVGLKCDNSDVPHWVYVYNSNLYHGVRVGGVWDFELIDYLVDDASFARNTGGVPYVFYSKFHEDDTSVCDLFIAHP